MTKNVGTREGHIRVGVAAVLVILALFVTHTPVVQIVFVVLAAILAGSAFMHTCPVNHMLGRNTCETPNDAPTSTENS